MQVCPKLTQHCDNEDDSGWQNLEDVEAAASEASEWDSRDRAKRPAPLREGEERLAGEE